MDSTADRNSIASLSSGVRLVIYVLLGSILLYEDRAQQYALYGRQDVRAQRHVLHKTYQSEGQRDPKITVGINFVKVGRFLFRGRA